VVAAIQSRREQGLSITSVWREDRPLYGAAKRHFGTWNNALSAIGITRPSPQTWTKQRVIETIRDRQRQGLPVRNVHRDDNKLYLAGYRLFGTWQKALEAAGVDSKPRKRWTKERVIKELRAAHRLGTTNIRRLDQGLVGAVWRHFGGLRQARLAAGLERPPKKWSRQRVIEAIQELHVSGTPSRAADWRQNRPLALAAVRYCGSWDDALVAAGLLKESEKPVPKPEWTKESVIRAIQNRHRHGLPMTGVYHTDGSLFYAATRHFGGWRNAMLAAGIAPKSERHWTKADVLRLIRKRQRQGLPLTKAWIDDHGLYYGARKHFGSWRQAVAAAALVPNEDVVE
jgi:hypothetical protein